MSENIYIRLTEKLKKTLEKTAIQRDISLSEHIRQKLSASDLELKAVNLELESEIEELKDEIKKIKDKKNYEFIILRKLIALLIIHKIDTEDLFLPDEEDFIEKIAVTLKHVLLQYKQRGSWTK